MADDKKLSSVVEIDGVSYDVLAKNAEVADKLANKLTISVKKGNAAATTAASFDGSENKTASIEIPTYTITKSGSTVTLTGSDGSTSSFTDSSGSGDMAKSVYDTNNNNKIDIAEDAEKLGGAPAADYAKKSDLFNQKIKTGSVTFGANDVVEFVGGTNVSIAGDATNKKITINATGGTGGGTSETASKIKVTMNDGITKDASITVKSTDPDLSSGNIGDIWFRY